MRGSSQLSSGSSQLSSARALLCMSTLKKLKKSQNCCSKNHKKSKLGHKVIIFISLERSCVTLHSEWLFFLISILLSSYLDFCEKKIF